MKQNVLILSMALIVLSCTEKPDSLPRPEPVLTGKWVLTELTKNGVSVKDERDYCNQDDYFLIKPDHTIEINPGQNTCGEEKIEKIPYTRSKDGKTLSVGVLFGTWDCTITKLTSTSLVVTHDEDIFSFVRKP